MDSYIPDLESTRVKLALAFAAYDADAVRLVERDVRGFTHLVASRQGLYVVSEQRQMLIVHGFFFGIAVRGEEIFVFESCDLPRGPTRHGRIIKLSLRDGLIFDATIVFKGLDNGCHQIDFIGSDLHVMDTYRQRVLRFQPGQTTCETLMPLPPVTHREDDPGYVHANSLLAVGDRMLLLLHHGAQHTGRKSEIAVFDQAWQRVETWPLDGLGCHGLALLEDGTVLTCGSLEGRLISPTGLQVRVSPHMTRGLAVGMDSVVVGASQMVECEGRLRNAGTVTFMDRQYNIRSVLEVPGAPTEVRRLDGQDYGLSNHVAGRPWGRTLRGPVSR